MLKRMVSDHSSLWQSVFFPAFGTQVPQKLLSGPWTEEKLNFLENVLKLKLKHKGIKKHGEKCDNRAEGLVGIQTIADIVHLDDCRSYERIGFFHRSTHEYFPAAVVDQGSDPLLIGFVGDSTINWR